MVRKKRGGGPQTREGKEASSKNATKHGVLAKTQILPDEDPQEYESLKQAWRARAEANNLLSETLVEHIARAHWVLKRAERRLMQAEECEWDGEEDDCDFEWIAQKQKMLDNLLRYKVSAERSLLRLCKEMNPGAKADERKRLALSQIAEIKLQMEQMKLKRMEREEDEETIQPRGSDRAEFVEDEQAPPEVDGKPLTFFDVPGEGKIPKKRIWVVREKDKG